MKKILFNLFIIVILFSCFYTVKADYNPVISGNFESGDRIYTDDLNEEDSEEIIDKYYYDRLWLKYKKKITTAEYYYIKIQYYKKEYDVSDTYNNIGLDFWGNYTYLITDNIRGRWKFNLKDKDYYTNVKKSYRSYRLHYELDYDYNKLNDYGFYIQRKWNNFLNVNDKDYIRDKINFDWDHEYSENFEINTSFQFERQIYTTPSESSNKYGKQVSISFKYEL